MYRIVLLNDDTTKAYYSTPILVAQTIGITLAVFFFSYWRFIKKDRDLIDLI
jgi:hypothetical protein